MHSGTLSGIIVFTGSVLVHYFSLPQEGSLQLLNEPTIEGTTCVCLI